MKKLKLNQQTIRNLTLNLPSDPLGLSGKESCTGITCGHATCQYFTCLCM